MNTAQKNLIALLNKIPKEETKDREFIQKCIVVWDDYDDSMIFFPNWQLMALEKEYGTSVASINEKY